MFKLFKSKKEKEAEKNIKVVSNVFGSLDILEEKGLLLWQEREKRLLIMEPLAVYMMRREDTWTTFLNNVYLWQMFNRQQEAWKCYITKEQIKAIQKVQKSTSHKLTKAETERVRRGVLENLTGNEVEQAKIERFEILVVKDNTTPIPNKEDSKGEIVIVGIYDPETEKLEMTLWEDIASKINKK